MSMQISENISLKKYNTFGIDVKAGYFAGFTNESELGELLVDIHGQHSHPALGAVPRA